MRAVSVTVVSTILVLLAVFGSASANGFLVPAVGARASGLGGAFIGLADDYSAAFWNPAGITQIEGAQVTVIGQDAASLGSREGMAIFQGATRLGNPVFADIQATSEAGHRLLPGVFLYPKFSLGALFDKVGLAAYTFTGYGTRWSGDAVYDDLIAAYVTSRNDPAGYRRVMGDAPDNESRLVSYAVTPVVAKEIVPGLSFGLAGQAVYTSLETKVGGWYEESWVDSSRLHPYQMEDNASGWGYCATAGVLYKATKALSVGAVIRTPMTVTVKGQIEVTSTAPQLVSPKQDQDYDLTFPMWAGLGLAYRDVLVNGLTLTSDVTWTQWSEFGQIVRNTETELPGEIASMDPQWDDTIEVGVGLDYRMSRAMSLRVGYRNVPSPVDAEHFTFVFPQIAKSVVSAGLTYRRDTWHADAALEYQAGESLDIPGNVNTDSNGKNLEDLLVASLALTYAF
jgi:long-chain fatty acid transport protein